MVKKANDTDIVGIMNKIQAQLAVLDRKLDAFMTKSLKELADAKAAVEKKAQHVPAPQVSAPRPVEQRPGRQMYAAICSHCGKDCEIPFKPSGERPVFCKECWAQRKSGNVRPSNGPKPEMASSYEPMPSLNVPVKPAVSTVVAKSTVTKKTTAKKTAAKKKTTAKKVVAKKAAKKK